MDRFTLLATTESGRTISFRIDPMSNTTSVMTGDASNTFQFPNGRAWEDNEVRESDVGDAILGLAPRSSFMTALQTVTLNPTKGKMIVGEYDAAPDCREGRVFFAPQDAGAETWKIPFHWDAEGFGSADVTFDIDYTGDSFVVPRSLSRPFYLFFSREIQDALDAGTEYTVEEARAAVPTIHLTMDGFDLPLTPERYVTDDARGLDTEFGFSPVRDPILPRDVLRKLVVQLDAANNRIGICTAH